jgi:hypothetical protein
LVQNVEGSFFYNKKDRGNIIILKYLSEATSLLQVIRPRQLLYFQLSDRGNIFISNYKTQATTLLPIIRPM